MAVVRQSALFGRLDEEEICEIIEGARISSVAKGEMLFLQGEQSDSFFLVLNGWVKVYRISPGGEEAIVGVFTCGQSFAEAVAFTGDSYPASAEAVTDARILRIPSNHLQDHIRKTPQLGIAILASLSQHLHSLVHQVEQLKAHTGAQRVAEFLVSLAPVESGSCEIKLPYDKTLLAGKLGIKPESLSRAFQRLKSRGVTIQRDTAIITDIRSLTDFMEQERAEVLKPNQPG